MEINKIKNKLTIMKSNISTVNSEVQKLSVPLYILTYKMILGIIGNWGIFPLISTSDLSVSINLLILKINGHVCQTHYESNNVRFEGLDIHYH
jgi:hypothetical protein